MKLFTKAALGALALASLGVSMATPADAYVVVRRAGVVGIHRGFYGVHRGFYGPRIAMAPGFYGAPVYRGYWGPRFGYRGYWGRRYAFRRW